MALQSQNYNIYLVYELHFVHIDIEHKHGDVDPKFPKGYRYACFSENRKKIAVSFKNNLVSSSGNYIYEYKFPQLKKPKILIEGNFEMPVYAKNNRYLAIRTNRRWDDTKKIEIYDIHILHARTSRSHKIGEGRLYVWI